jgi:hypothetical protein
MGEWRYNSTIHDLNTRWRWIVSFMLRPYNPQRKEPRSTRWIWGWVGPGIGLDAVEKRKISCVCLELNPRCPDLNPSLYQLSYPGSIGLLIYDSFNDAVDKYLRLEMWILPAWSKARNVFTLSNAGIVGSNVCVSSVFVLSCVASGRVAGWSSVLEALPTVCEIHRSFRLTGTGHTASSVKGSRKRFAPIASPMRSNNANHSTLTLGR